MGDKEDPVLSSEDRIEWLRHRGVQIEMPASTRKEKKTRDNSLDEGAEDNMMSLSVVMIPADEREACEEIFIRIDKRKTGDQLTEALKNVFATDEYIDTSLAKETAAKQFGNMEVSVSDKSIRKVAQDGSVEMFALARPHEKNGYEAVNIYLDEAGQLKRLRPNPRAAAIAALCGFRSVPFAGDVFVGRIKIAGNQVMNKDFRLFEISSDAAWMKGVEAINYEYGIATNSVTMHPEEPITSGVDLEGGFSWREDESSMELTVALPEELTTVRSKDVHVQFSSLSVRVSVEGSGWRLLVPLLRPVSADDCTWTLSGSAVEVTMEKTTAALWGKVH